MATPSTLVWNPATDLQAKGTGHLGIDNYFSDKAAFSTDIGYTYGVNDNIEVGVDLLYPNAASAFTFNAKYGVGESDKMPAMAIGVMGFGLNQNDSYTDFRTYYGVVAKTFGSVGRITGGYFTGNSNVIGADNKGFILAWDKAINDKVWACVDYASGDSTLGALFGGVSYMFAPNTSVIFGLGKFNNGGASYWTAQMDINI
jgi:hypothetical protein